MDVSQLNNQDQSQKEVIQMPVLLEEYQKKVMELTKENLMLKAWMTQKKAEEDKGTE